MNHIQRRLICSGAALGLLLTTAISLKTVAAQSSTAKAREVEVPMFEVDPAFFKLPNGWHFASVTDVACDSHNNVWVYQRPYTIYSDQKTGPSVMEFDPKGNYIQGWGGRGYGEGKGFQWPQQEHGISIDSQDHVWLTGSWDNDQVYEFTTDGKLIKQFGDSNGGYKKSNSQKTNFFMPTKAVHYLKTNELFVSDGYGNTRVDVLDATTGAFKRMWGAFGNTPEDITPISFDDTVRMVTGRGLVEQDTPALRAQIGHEFFRQPYYINGGKLTTDAIEGETHQKAPVPNRTDGPPQFFIVHTLAISNDGLVYVADRMNERVQIFTLDGKFLKSVWIDPWMATKSFAAQTATGFAFSNDPEQRFLYIGTKAGPKIWVYDRKTMQPLYAFGRRGKQPGEFEDLHMIGSDSKGNIYTADLGSREAQKFVFVGLEKKWVDGNGNFIDPKTGFVLAR